jgi:hypothetical protein
MLEKPARQVSFLFASQDRSFATRIKRTMESAGIHVREEGFEAKTDEALVLVLTPWLLQVPTTAQSWRAALENNTPIIPILLEDTPNLPIELSRLNWIDCRSRFAKAQRDLLAFLRYEHHIEPAAYTLNSPKRSDEEMTVAPWYVSVLVYSLMISSALQAAQSFIVVPLHTTYIRPYLSLAFWLSALGFALIAYLGITAADRLRLRSLSLEVLIIIELTSTLYVLTMWPVLWREMAWIAGSTGSELLTVVVANQAVIWILIGVNLKWLPRGWIVRGGNLSRLLLGNIPVVFLIVGGSLYFVMFATNPILFSPILPIPRDETIIDKFTNGLGDCWLVTGVAGERLWIGAESDSLEISLTLFDPNGNMLADSPFAPHVRVGDIKLPYTGTYQIAVRPAFQLGAYRLRVNTLR